MDSPYKAQSLFEVNNLVAVVTGGGSGLGRVMAHALAANGAKAVYILGRRDDSLKATKDASSRPRVIHPIVCDVTSKDALAAAAERVRNEVGYCDVVFANSGVATAMVEDVVVNTATSTVKDVQQSLWKPSMEEFTKSLHVNVTAVFYTAVAFLDLLDEGNKRAVVPQKSQVVITSSIAGYIRVVVSSFAYASSKAAVTQLGKQLASTLAPFKIRVNTLAPGIYPSEMTDDTLLKGISSNPRDEGSMPKERIPLQRAGTEEEIAGAALFLASTAGGYLDGFVLLTDGGRTSIVPATY
ncbi:hypothetical protein L249_6133 [Ophiocordyceps polyrhachis-furcata BCC 54312]|uniref:Uncharacterized protein n=1 Tax=Ophiocordyceps polyrhachis-furcata BCC 54312 TaxID=1330021 RepID=A0A367LIN3_9HYPO|nr:hypothetical protein L249_6133 [Ophiocordyceps polyrhachis-furcata BCC 54312]